MTRKQAYLCGCRFAIEQLTKYGGIDYITHDENDDLVMVEWKEILEWLNSEFEKDLNKD